MKIVRSVNGLKRIFLLATFMLICAVMVGMAAVLTGCSGDKADERLMLHLSFDEGRGTVVHDKSGNVRDGKVQYVFNEPKYQDEALDPEWRAKGVNGGCLLFDGYSNYIKYDYEDIKVRGNKFSVSAYVAPRAFEWDDPTAKENGNDKLTAIVAQSYKAEGQGFIFGYQRHGSWSLQVGIGERWISVWDDNMPLKKYEWNHIVGTFDGEKGVMRLYLNGEKAGEKTFFEGSSIEAAVDEPLYVAKNNDHPYSNATASGNMVSGLIDELKLYKAVLSESEIKSMCGALPEIAFDDIWLQNILTEDYYKTQLHGGPYQHWMNEPHAPMYYNGKYHLFFQFNPVGPYFHNICWGHLVSDDMVNWKPIKEVITPTAGSVAPDGVWSGGVTYDKNGVPLLFFTAGNDSYRSNGLISNQNVGVAYPKDITDPELIEWVVCDELAIRQRNGEGRTGEFRDMHIWQEGNTWCMLIGTGATNTNGGTAILYTATTLECKFDGTVDMNWQYKGPVYQMTNQPSNLGKVWELPVILPIKNQAGTITKYVFFISPAPADSADNKIYYFLGNFSVSSGKFTPDAKFNNKPALLDYSCNVFTGPSGFIDPVSGSAHIFSIMQDQRAPGDVAASGWANCVGFARKITLNDAGTDIKVSTVESLANYENETLVDLISPKTIQEANVALSGIGTDMMHIRITFENVDAMLFGIRVKTGNDGVDLTSYTYDVTNKTIIGATQNKGQNAQSSRMSGDLEIKNDKLTMDIYIDRSLVEAFFNNDKALTIRSYASFQSTGIEVFAEGGSVIISELHVTSMKSIYKQD